MDRHTLVKIRQHMTGESFEDARDQVDEFLISIGTPVAYFKQHDFHHRRVGNPDINEFRQDENMVEITKEEFDRAMDMFELGL